MTRNASLVPPAKLFPLVATNRGPAGEPSEANVLTSRELRLVWLGAQLAPESRLANTPLVVPARIVVETVGSRSYELARAGAPARWGLGILSS